MSDDTRVDIAALAKGGRTNFFGFLLRLAARLPFLFIAGRLYGAESLGRFALALVVVELSAQLCTLGQKRGLAMRLSKEQEHPANTVADAMLLGGSLAVVATAIIYLLPDIMFGASACLTVDGLVGAHMLEKWQSGESSLRMPEVLG